MKDHLTGRFRFRIPLAMMLALAVMAGCEEKEPVTLSYTRQASYPVPDEVRRIAIAPFGATDGTEAQWGSIAADSLASVLDAYNKKYQRYVLVDRKRVSAIMDERDFQRSIADTDAAVSFGRIARVDAMIYGTVNVSSDDDWQEKTYFDPLSQSLKSKRVRRRYAMASVNFTMDDVATTRTICSVTVTKEYDSEKADKSWTTALGFGGEKAPATDHIINALIEKCIEEFVTRISPHEIVVDVKLQKPASTPAKQGNTFAMEGEFADAIEWYRRGLEEKPDDHGAMFNMGVCHEALGHLEDAEACYDKALEMKVERKYVRARKRVRMEDGTANESQDEE